MIRNVCWSSCKVPVVFVQFELIFNFLGIFSINSQTSYIINIRPVGVELSHVGGRKDGRTWRNQQSLFAILRTSLKNPVGISHCRCKLWECFQIFVCVLQLVSAGRWELPLNSLNTELNPTSHLLALLGAHQIFHVSRMRVKEWVVIR